MKRIYIICIGLCLAFLGCEKDSTEKSVEDEAYNNRLTFILKDNIVNFSRFSITLDRSGNNRLLMEKGPFTVLVPDNNAFDKAGYYSDQEVQTERANIWGEMAPYHILDGTFELNKLPYKFNQEILTRNGSPIFVTRWIKDADTVLTINGTPVKAYNMAASNGLIQVIDALLKPLAFSKLDDAIAADADLTYFNAALQRSGLKAMMEGSDPLTVFAPVNAAFKKEGYQSTDAIYQESPQKLKALLLFNMLSNRRFIYDYILTTDESNVTQQQMLDGNGVTINIVNNTITVEGPGNITPTKLLASNIITGNGVIHKSDQLLKNER